MKKAFHEFKTLDDELILIDLYSIVAMEININHCVLVHTTGGHYHVYSTIKKLTNLLDRLK